MCYGEPDNWLDCGDILTSIFDLENYFTSYKKIVYTIENYWSDFETLFRDDLSLLSPQVDKILDILIMTFDPQN